MQADTVALERTCEPASSALAAPASGSPTEASPHAILATTGINVDASVPNCDIEVDGNFVGSTPSTINLALGKHEIVVKKTGYKDWSNHDGKRRFSQTECGYGSGEIAAPINWGE